MQVSSAIGLNVNVDIYSFPADFTYEDYQKLSKVEREKYLVDRGHNLVVNAGLDQCVDLFVGTDTSSWTHSSVGSDNTAAAAGQTDLISAIGSRLAITNRYKVSTGQAHFDTFYSSSANNGSWNEAGIFNASSSGDMLCRRVLAATFTKSTSNTAVVAWTITLTAV